ncbi:hypothetical protein VTJ83DRAFT_437 [Remersonia thermophila]|uniref:DUF4332 domain-containing protein n=1 Tax=Remersonia thermophila TaxID=72144 RepID=A0ABR4DKZ1_9PEZI
MVSASLPSPDTISDSEFREYLERYPACVAEISEAKGAKPGQQTLARLDEYRYGTALDTFGPASPDAVMGLDDVKTLVEWKLRHGKFRPTLMKLVSSNDPDTVRNTIQEAIAHYRNKADVSGTIDMLAKLKGIGPATASLLLAVHDPDNVAFFADEAFYWLCCGGVKAPIKYNAKEYADLNARARKLAQRLGVRAVDVERVAFVLMRQPEGDADKTVRKPSEESRVPSAKEAPAQKPPAKIDTGSKQEKRKASGDGPAAGSAVRRSKRGKQQA